MTGEYDAVMVLGVMYGTVEKQLLEGTTWEEMWR